MTAIASRVASLKLEANYLLRLKMPNEALECLSACELLGCPPPDLRELRALALAQLGRVQEALNPKVTAVTPDLVQRLIGRIESCRSIEELSHSDILRETAEVYCSQPALGEEFLGALTKGGADPAFIDITRAFCWLRTRGTTEEAIKLLSGRLSGKNFGPVAASLATIYADCGMMEEASQLRKELLAFPLFAQESSRWLDFVKNRGSEFVTPAYQQWSDNLIASSAVQPPELRMIVTMGRGGTGLIRELVDELLGKRNYHTVNGQRLAFTSNEQFEKIIFAEENRDKYPCEHVSFSHHGELVTKHLYPRIRTVYVFRHPLDALTGTFRFTRFTGGILGRWEDRLREYLTASRYELRAAVYETVSAWFRSPQFSMQEYELVSSEELAYLTSPPGTLKELIGDVVQWIQSERVLPVRYEDLILNPGRELQRIAQFWGVAVSPDKISSIVARNFYYFGARGIIARYPTIGHLDDGIFARGNPGEWRGYVGPHEMKAVQQAAGPQLAYLGYALT